MREEFDTVGSKMIPDDAYYGIHTARARENFPIPCLPNDPELLKNFLKIKEAAALANKAAGRWSDDKVPDAIVEACHDIADHFEDYEEEFRLPSIQGGAGYQY
jgi:aspartate ammonia-lyase